MDDRAEQRDQLLSPEPKDLAKEPDGRSSVVFDAADFGYSYVPAAGSGSSTTASEAAGHGSQAQAGLANGHPQSAIPDEEEELVPFKNVFYPAGAPGSHGDFKMDGPSAAAISACTCCCCISFVGLITGAFLIDHQRYSDGGAVTIAGAALVGAGILFFCCGILLCFAACLLACIRGGVEVGRGKEWSLKRLNDQYEQEIRAYDDLRFYVEDESNALRSLNKREKSRQAKRRDECKKQAEELVKKDIEEGLTPNQIQNKRRPTVFKIVFDGDIYVSSIGQLREQISICLAAGSKFDTVCVVLTSGGGAVTMYGLAAAQLARVRKAGLRLVVCVDSIAASGGYLMATMANEICASPFALVGSVGVISIVPNVQKLLEKHDVNTYVLTAGKFKRTIDVVGDVTDEGKAKAIEELEAIHQVFKDHICVNRPALVGTIDQVATGEAWLAVEGIKKGLVDSIMTSDEFLHAACKTHDVVHIKPKTRNRVMEGLLQGAAASAAQFFKSAPASGFKQQEPLLL